MKAEEESIQHFLEQYQEQVCKLALVLREVVLSYLPGVTEQLDLPAKMIAYCYGQKYSELICVLIPSKKGLKLGFNKGNELPDPEKLLKGTGKISRYVEINSKEEITAPALKKLILTALEAYRKRST